MDEEIKVCSYCHSTHYIEHCEECGDCVCGYCFRVNQKGEIVCPDCLEDEENA